MPRLRGTTLLARVPFAELGPWPMGTAHEARVPFEEIGPGVRGTALATQVPFAGTAPCEYATEGVGARGPETEAIFAAFLDKLTAGERASSETNGGVPYSAAGGRAVRDVPPSGCPISGADGTWLTCIRVSALVVASPYAHSGSDHGSRRGGRGWDTTMIVRRVLVTGVTTVTVYLVLVLVEPPFDLNDCDYFSWCEREKTYHRGGS